MVNAAPIDGKFGKSCAASECHPTAQQEAGALSHVPYLEEWCDRCHDDHQSQSVNLLKVEEPQMCLACHTDVETDGGALAHPAGAGNCTSCHDPHASNVRHLLRDDEKLLGCVGCHGEDLAREREKPFHHQYFDPEKECGSCHYAHQNSETAYLRRNVGETCLTCHDMSIVIEGRKLENVGAKLQSAAHVHQPAKIGMCQLCHTPHGSIQPSLLSDSYPAGNYAKYDRANYQLCWQCHSPDLVEANPTEGATKFRDGSKNLHELHVVKFGKGRACHLCHTAHAGDRSHLLRDSTRFGSWEGPMVFVETPNGGSCATACHREKGYDRLKK